MEGSRLNTYRGSEFLAGTRDRRGDRPRRYRRAGKVNLLESRGKGLALIEEIRLPTARDEDLLGAGKASLRTVFIASSEAGRIAAMGTSVRPSGACRRGLTTGAPSR
jgi:hypothetical protein